MAPITKVDDGPIYSGDKSDPRRYSKDIVEDITQARKLLEEYSGIPPDRVLDHIHAVREKAWAIHPYPCVGRFRFLDLSISRHPLYPHVLRRLKEQSQTLLDLGCCFGQDIRRLVSDGAPAQNLYAADLHPEFLELGFELFGDKDRLRAHFLTGDVFDDDHAAELASLDAKIDVIHAASFLHLFDWDAQVRAATRMVRMLRPAAKDALVLGRQVGTQEPASYRGRFRHDADSFQRMWDEVGAKTGTKWMVKAELLPLTEREKELQVKDGGEEEGRHMRWMVFEVHKI